MHALLPASSATAVIGADFLLVSRSVRSRVTADNLRIIRAELYERWEHYKGALISDPLILYTPPDTLHCGIAPCAAFVRDWRAIYWLQRRPSV